MTSFPPLFCLLGPTASGKTAAMVALAEYLPIEVVSVDAVMLYRGLEIGSGKPTADELTACPHHLISCLDPLERYSAAQFVADATQVIEGIYAKNRLPVLVGGTMLYFRAFQQGLSPLPAGDPGVREAIEAEAALIGWAEMHQQLQSIDPVAAARIQPQDAQRLCRAIEVYRMTGQPLSELQKIPPTACPYSCVNVVLFPERRAWLHDRIAVRFQQMMQQGLVAEVQALLAQWPGLLEAASMRSVGYRQVLDHLQGEYGIDALVEKGIAATRQLAKRQCTWLRSWQDPIYLDPERRGMVEMLQNIMRRCE